MNSTSAKFIGTNMFLIKQQENFIEVVVAGKITKLDYTEILIPYFEELFKSQNKVNILVTIDQGFYGYEMKAAFYDMSFGLKNRKKFGKIAIVDLPKYIVIPSKILAKIFGFNIKCFKQDEEAVKWLS